MILWLNGAFGAGKTVTAAEIHRRLKDSIIYDPETVGFWLRKQLPKSRTKLYPNFQDDPLWRKINLNVMTELAETYSGTILVPMTLIDPAYYHELIGGLRSTGVEVKHVVLGTSAEVLKKRQHSRFEFSGSWSARHSEKCLKALSAPPFEGYIDTSGMSVRVAAEAVGKAAGLTLEPQGSYLAYLSTKWSAQIGAIR